MKKNKPVINTYRFCIILCVGFLAACSDKHPESIKIQSVQVEQIIPLTNSEDGKFTYPKFSLDGSKIVFTGADHNGLFYFDLKAQHMLNLNLMSGAGIDFIVSTDQSRVFFISDTLQNRRRFYHLWMQEFESTTPVRLTELPYREISGLTEYDNNLSFFTKEGIRTIDWQTQQISTELLQQGIYRVQGDQLIIYQDGREEIYIPFANQSLIWPDVIPGTGDMLIYVTGRGLFRYYSAKNESRLLGDFKAAHSSPDGKLIAYMQDEDDGHRTTRSDIYVSTLDELKSFVITNTKDEHEMYPQWSPDSRQIVFHNSSGQIYLAKLIIN